MRTAIIIPCLSAFLALSAAAQQETRLEAVCPRLPACEEDPKPTICERLVGTLSFETHEGFVQRLEVVMKEWQIVNEATVEIPHQGWLMVHLRAGELATGYGDERKEWHAGSSWTVPAHERLIVHTARDSVVLQTVDFETQ